MASAIPGRVIRAVHESAWRARGVAVGPGGRWGPMRTVYLQYASDPITFFDYHDLYRQPDWMKPPRGPDVSPQLRWYPS